MTEALSERDIETGLRELPGWRREGDALVKIFRFDSYLAGIAFAASVGIIAEGLNHHPDMQIGWRQLRVSFTTHDAGNRLSAKDFAAARAIEGLGYPR